jgi:hypothetical protein
MSATGMTYNRFNNITRYLRIWDVQPERDPWYPVRQLIREFNNNMVGTVLPGTNLCVDELMIAWRGAGGQDGHHDRHGLPHVSKIIRYVSTTVAPVSRYSLGSQEARSRWT